MQENNTTKPKNKPENNHLVSNAAQALKIMTKDDTTRFFEDLAWSEMSDEYTIDLIMYFLASIKSRINENYLDAQDFINDLERYVYGEMTHHGNSQRELYAANIANRLRTFDYEKTGLPRAEEAFLDISSHLTAEGECLNIAQTVNSKITDPETPEEKRSTLKLMVDEMVTGGLKEYAPQVVEAFMCAPENNVWCASFQKELRGDFDND